MSAETSKQPENTPSQSGKSIAEGKRKGESNRSALSLQDAFSDPANLAGMQEKTLPMFATEHGKMAQLKVEKIRMAKQRRRGGRKKYLHLN